MAYQNLSFVGNSRKNQYELEKIFLFLSSVRINSLWHHGSEKEDTNIILYMVPFFLNHGFDSGLSLVANNFDWNYSTRSFGFSFNFQISYNMII
jgi:hypothetical protein